MGGCFRKILSCWERLKPTDNEDSALQKKNDDYHQNSSKKNYTLEIKQEKSEHEKKSVGKDDGVIDAYANNYSIPVGEKPRKSLDSSSKKKTKSTKEDKKKNFKEEKQSKGKKHQGGKKDPGDLSIIDVSSNTSEHQLVYSEINDEHTEIDSYYDLLRPKCMQCKKNANKVIGFLCNHNACEDCAILHCAKLIVQFYHNYSANPNSHIEFSYYCPVASCDKKIAFPSVLVVKRIRKSLEDNGFRQMHPELVILNEGIVDLWIPYFDGLTASYFN